MASSDHDGAPPVDDAGLLGQAAYHDHLTGHGVVLALLLSAGAAVLGAARALVRRRRSTGLGRR